jgi:hypothetical protein
MRSTSASTAALRTGRPPGELDRFHVDHSWGTGVDWHLAG